MSAMSDTTTRLNAPALCCWIDQVTGQACPKPAEWELVYHKEARPDPYDFSHSCTPHIGDLLDDSDEILIRPYREGPPIDPDAVPPELLCLAG